MGRGGGSIARNQLNSCRFVHLFLECQNFGGFLGMAKRHHALVKDRPRFKGAYSKALATATGIRKGRQDVHVTVDALIIFYVGSGL